MQNTNSLLSLLEQILSLKDKSKEEIESLNSLIVENSQLCMENKDLKSRCEKFEKDVAYYKEEAESLKKVSIIKNMSRQVHDLKIENDILQRKIKHYKSVGDIKTDSSLLSASNFDGKEINDIESIEIAFEDTINQYNIKEPMARLFNIPIETTMTSKDAVTKVLDYIESAKLYSSKTRTLKYDYKLYEFLNIKDELSITESADLFRNLCKIVKDNGLDDGNFDNHQRIEQISVKKTIEDYISSNENKSIKSSIVNTEEPEEDIEEEEELEVTKIGKRYYYVSVGTNIVYKAVKLKKGEYDVGKRMGTYDGKSIIKD